MANNGNDLEMIVFPPQPSILINIQREVNKDNCDVRNVARQIAADITLSAALLQTVNSPFYGLRNKVISVPDAVNLIGLGRTLNLVTAASVRNSMPMPKGLEYFWDDTTKVAIASGTVAKYLRLNADLAYLMGLFHDAAVPLMAARFPDYLDSLAEFHHAQPEISVAESAKYKMNHTTLGGLLARAWHLPAPLIEAIRHHHTHEIFRMSLDGSTIDLLAVFLIAEHVVADVNGSLDIHFPFLEAEVREHLDLHDEDRFQTVLDLARDSIDAA